MVKRHFRIKSNTLYIRDTPGKTDDGQKSDNGMEIALYLPDELEQNPVKSGSRARPQRIAAIIQHLNGGKIWAEKNSQYRHLISAARSPL